MRKLAMLLAAVAVASGCGGDDTLPPPPPPVAEIDAADGPTVVIEEPTGAGELRGSIPIRLRVGSPAAPLAEVGVEVAGTRRILCTDWPPVPALLCGGELSVWELGLGAGEHALLAWATDGAGRTATAAVTLRVRPWLRPRWEFTGDAIVHPLALAGDLVLAPSDQLYALDAATGAERWSVPTPGVVTSAPVLDGAGHVVLATSHSDLYAYHPDGALAWSLELPSAGDRAPAIVPVVAPDGTLYQQLVGQREAWHVSAAGARLDVLPLPEAWTSALTVAAGGTVLVAADDGLHAVLPGGGDWFHATAGRVLEPARLDADGRIYFAAEGEAAFALEPGGAVAWTLPFPELIKGTPFAAGGLVYVGVLGTEFAHVVDRAGAPVEELPYCGQPDGFVADAAGRVFCTRYHTVYSLDVAALTRR